jgi:hypothetical protein
METLSNSETIGHHKHRKQKYRSHWESIQEFKGWLKPVENNNFKAKCIKCNVTFVSELSTIKYYSKGTKHLNLIKSAPPKSTLMMTNFTSFEKDDLDKDVKIAEIKLTGYLAEHNISFNSIEHLEGLLKSIFPDSKICQKIKLKRTKATSIIKNVITPCAKENLAYKLKQNQFPILIDESTDIASESTLGIIVRFFDSEVGQIVSRF